MFKLHHIKLPVYYLKWYHRTPYELIGLNSMIVSLHPCISRLWQTYRERPEGGVSRGAVPMPRKREEDMCPVMNQFSYVNIVVPSRAILLLYA